MKDLKQQNALFEARGLSDAAWKKRWLSLLLAALMMFALIPPIAASAAQNGMVRILLSSMGTTSSVAIKLEGEYGIPSKPQIGLSSGKSVVVAVSGGQLTLNTGSQTISMGSSFTIKSYANSKGTNLMTLYNPRSGYGTISYLGDMQFSVSGGSLRMISYLYIEDYLLGVVPYEMSNTFPVEALKAQAIAARSYTIRRMSATRSYDLQDTTADQVYKGYRSSDNIAHQAIRATEGVVIMSNGAVADCYYSASNGGQTELPANALTITQDHNVGCYAMVDDPYDLRNPDSEVATVNFTSSGTFSNVGLEQEIKNAAAAQLGSGNLSIYSITNPQLTGPRNFDQRGVGICRFYQTLEMTVATSAGTANIKLNLQDTVAPACAPRSRLFSLTSDGVNYTLTGRRYGHGVGLSQRGAEQMAKEGLDFHYILNFYYPGGQQTKLDLTKETPEAKPSSSSSASSADAIGTGLVKLSDTSSTLTVRKTASASASKVTSVKHNDTLDVLGIEGDWLCVTTDGKTGYVMSKYVIVTMKPTSSPDTPTVNNDPAFARGNITLQNDSAIRVRSAPDTATSEVLGYVPQGALVDLLGVSGEWYRIRYEGLVGYIMIQYITINPAYPVTDPSTVTPAPTTAPTPTPTPAPVVVGYGKATRATGVYSGEGRYYTKLADLAKNEPLEILKKDAYWCYVKGGGVTGYAPTEDITFTDSPAETPKATSTPKATPKPSSSAKATPKPTTKVSTGSTATVTTATKGASVTLRAEANSSSARVGSVKDGTVVTVLERGSSFTKVKVGDLTGYIANSYLK